MFTDEAIYVRWAQISLQDASWRFISLTDGKQPMYVWVAMLFIKFVNDPLLAGRLVSVFSGFFTMLGLFILSLELFKSKSVAFITAGLYVVFPFAVVLDRMAIYDSMVAAFYVWALYFSVLLVRHIRLDLALILGFIIGGGVLTKSSNFFSIYLMPFLLVLFNFKQKKLKFNFLKFIILTGVSAGVAFGFYNVLRLSPLFEMISAKNATFVYPFSDWIKHPLTYFVSNISGLTSWLLQYLSFSYSFLIIIAIALIHKFTKEKLILIIYFLLPFLALSVFGKLIYPRFIFLMSIMLLPLAAWGMQVLFEKTNKRFSKNLMLSWTTKAIILIVVVSYQLVVSVSFIVDPVNAKIADADRGQYVNGWAAGWGVRESVVFFEKESKDKKIFVATEGTFGLMPQALEIYLIKNKNITVQGYWPVDIFPKEVLEKASIMPTYFIFYQPQHVKLPFGFPLELVFQVKQGSSDTYYRIYKVTAGE